MESTILKVNGMSCGHCEATVQGAVSKLSGIKKVKASSKKKLVTVKYDTEAVSLSEIKNAIKESGFEVID